MLYLDFETRCSLDLKKVGLAKYAEKAEVLCTGYAVDDGPAQVSEGLPMLATFCLPVRPYQGHQLVAHNAAFERAILKAQGIDIPWERWIDTAAMAAHMSLPRHLGALAEALRLDAGKDRAGQRVMLKLSRPRGGWSDDDFWEVEDKPEDFETLYQYCKRDVEVMREAYRRMVALPAQEARLWALTGRMNDAGVAVDIGSLAPAQALLEAASAVGTARFKALTGGHGVKSYARAAGALGLADVRKPTVRNALRDPATTPRVKEALTLFQQLAKSSPAKLEAFRRRTSDDGRCRGMLVYAGAERTGRWSGMGVQPQNFPRGLGEGTDQFFEALRLGVVEHLYDNPVATVAEALRGFLVGPFIVGDYSQIEARVLAWFAKQTDLLDIFAAKGDPYRHMAARIYGKNPKFVTKDERFMGKQAVLGCGFGMGWEKFQRMLDEIYDVDISTEMAMRVVNTYRQANGQIPMLWGRLEAGFKHVLNLKLDRLQVLSNVVMGNVTVGGLHYIWIEIPSGRRLYYCEPEMTEDGLKYWGRNIYTGGKWDRVGTWGGKITENIVQSTARDIMADAMLRLDAAGFRLVLTVHDEIVADEPMLPDKFKEIMLTLPSWAAGLPVDAEVFQAARYRK